MRKMLGVLLVVALLAAGGVAYALLSSSSATAQDENATTAQDESGTTDTTVVDDPESDDTTTDDGVARQGRRDILGEVLEGLVADNVITQEQADQIRDAIAAKREELRAEFGSSGERGFGDRHGFRGFGPGFEDFLADGVIDADELAQLPEGNPLTDPDGPAAPYLEDGQITQEELDQLMADLQAEGFRFRHGFGTDSDQDATESSFSF